MQAENVGSTQAVVLDPRIRDWVLIPIFVVMFLIALVRQWAAVAMSGERRPKPTAVQERQTLARAERLRRSHTSFLARTFAPRRVYFTREMLNVTTPPASDSDGSSGAPNPLMASGMDQGGMTDMVKAQVMGVLPQLAMMGWVGYFFAGFVVVRLPFMLTPRFRAMLQRGVELAGLDFSYVSSLSWYVLLLLGLRGVTALILERDASAPAVASDAAMMGMPQAAPAAPGQQPDITKLYKAEAENLDLVPHESSLLDDVEQRLISSS